MKEELRLWAERIKTFDVVVTAARLRENVGQVTVEEYLQVLDTLKLVHSELDGAQTQIAKFQEMEAVLIAFAERLERSTEDELKRTETPQSDERQ
jgi:hypothetical protein